MTKQMRMKSYALNCLSGVCLFVASGCEIQKSESDRVLENYVRVPYDQYIDNDAYYVPPNSYYNIPNMGPDPD